LAAKMSMGSCRTVYVSLPKLANFQIPSTKAKCCRYNPNQNISTPPPKTPVATLKNDVTLFRMNDKTTSPKTTQINVAKENPKKTLN